MSFERTRVRNTLSVASTTSSTSSRTYAAKTSSTSNSLMLRTNQGDRERDLTNMTNITVVARCRGRNEREIATKSPVVVDSSGQDKQQIAIKLSNSSSSLNNSNTGDHDLDSISQKPSLALSGNSTSSIGGSAVCTDNAYRTFKLDQVFGPDADQSMIYDDVVAPILEDMLTGMNCTIFAYGQTGTGKTYTMSGDEKCVNGSFAHDAGIIPRVLYKLFSALELEHEEHSVKCSFIELYNEDLRDLISLNDDPVANNKKIKIFDSTSKKGAITIQGLEEFYIHSADEGLKILQRGLKKRQVAATKINDFSSRSHTIFTITIYTKQSPSSSTNPGSPSELFKVGKINLVDLAGSENISRSGAENKRAREAGMINQSLLTLGRVINSLVDAKSSHIPYRESKLTRLLQDSLGGHTKTCIIATISPVKDDLEETLSTLEYACRAKNIKNKPQTNTMTNKSSLLKEYTLEIERLKSDLSAAWNKNGIHLAREHYDSLMAENESSKSLLDEQRKKLSTSDVQLKKTRDNLETFKKQYFDTKRESDNTARVHGKLQTDYDHLASELAITKQQLYTETMAKRAYESTETELKVIGHEHINLLDQIITDVNHLHDKLESQRGDTKLIKTTISSTSQDIVKMAQALTRKFDEFETHKLKNELAPKFSDILNNYSSAQAARIELLSTKIMENFDGEFKQFKEKISSSHDTSGDNAKVMIETLTSIRERVIDDLNQNLYKLLDDNNGLLDVMNKNLDQFSSFVSNEFTSTFTTELIQLISSFNQENVDQIKDLKTLLGTSLGKLTESIAGIKLDFDKVIADEQAQSQNDSEVLAKSLTHLVEKFESRKMKRLGASMGTISSRIAAVSEEKIMPMNKVSSDLINKILGGYNGADDNEISLKLQDFIKRNFESNIIDNSIAAHNRDLIQQLKTTSSAAIKETILPALNQTLATKLSSIVTDSHAHRVKTGEEFKATISSFGTSCDSLIGVMDRSLRASLESLGELNLDLNSVFVRDFIESEWKSLKKESFEKVEMVRSLAIDLESKSVNQRLADDADESDLKKSRKEYKFNRNLPSTKLDAASIQETATRLASIPSASASSASASSASSSSIFTLKRKFDNLEPITSPKVSQLSLPSSPIRTPLSSPSRLSPIRLGSSGKFSFLKSPLRPNLTAQLGSMANGHESATSTPIPLPIPVSDADAGASDARIDVGIRDLNGINSPEKSKTTGELEWFSDREKPSKIVVVDGPGSPLSTTTAAATLASTIVGGDDSPSNNNKAVKIARVSGLMPSSECLNSVFERGKGSRPSSIMSSRYTSKTGGSLLPKPKSYICKPHK